MGVLKRRKEKKGCARSDFGTNLLIDVSVNRSELLGCQKYFNKHHTTSVERFLMIKAASKRVVGRLIGLMRQKEHETLPTFFMNFDLFISPPPEEKARCQKKDFRT